MHVCNREFYGYLPDQTVNALDSDSAMESFLHLRLQHLLNGPNRSYNEPLAVSEHLAAAAKPKKRTRLGFDQIYVVNLARRSDRRARIQATLDDMNLAYQMFEAVDGRSIDDEYVRKLGAKPLPLYRDPYNDRPLNFGEIGCFLSHYFIWKDVCF
jgi:collagen beta-1,O-galactosyltransferase